MQDYSDAQLITAYLEGNEESLAVLIKRYLKPIYSFAYTYARDEAQAQDITQETFVKAWKSIKKFDQSKSFKTWLFTIAKNTALDALKKKRTIPFSAFENEAGENMLTETLADPSPSALEILQNLDKTKSLAMTLEKLPSKYREILVLYYTQHLNFREIAERLNISLNTIKSQHRRALIVLKKKLALL